MGRVRRLASLGDRPRIGRLRPTVTRSWVVRCSPKTLLGHNSGRKQRVESRVAAPFTTQSEGGALRIRTGVHRSQTDDSQIDALRAAGCHRIWTDTESGRLARRPEWDACLDYLRSGDELVVTRLSRIARSVRHLTEVAAVLEERGIDLVVLKQGIDTTTPAGRFLFHVIGAMDEMLADLISEGTLEGLEAARARGRTGGANPSSPHARSPSPDRCMTRKPPTANAATPSTRSPKPSTSPARPSTATSHRPQPAPPHRQSEAGPRRHPRLMYFLTSSLTTPLTPAQAMEIADALRAAAH